MSALPPPPAHQPYGPYPGPYGGVVRSGRPLQPLGGLAAVASVLLGVMGLLSILVAAAFFNRAGVIDDFLNGGPAVGNPGLGGRLQKLRDADDFVAGAVVVYAIGVLATAGFFIAWQYRHARNAEALAGRSGLGPGWAIGGWFIPCANLVLPAVELHGSSRGSDPALDPQVPRRQGRGSGLVIAWAGVYGLANVLFSAGRAWFPDENEVRFGLDRANDAVGADNLSGASSLLLVVAAVLGIVMVQALTKRQAAKAADLTARGVLGFATYGSPGPYGYAGPPAGFPGGGGSGPGYGPVPGQAGGPAYGPPPGQAQASSYGQQPDHGGGPGGAYPPAPPTGGPDQPFPPPGGGR